MITLPLPPSEGIVPITANVLVISSKEDNTPPSRLIVRFLEHSRQPGGINMGIYDYDTLNSAHHRKYGVSLTSDPSMTVTPEALAYLLEQVDRLLATDKEIDPTLVEEYFHITTHEFRFGVLGPTVPYHDPAMDLPTFVEVSEINLSLKVTESPKAPLSLCQHSPRWYYYLLSQRWHHLTESRRHAHSLPRRRLPSGYSYLAPALGSP